MGSNFRGFYRIRETRHIEKKVSLWLLFGVQHSIIMADYHTWNTTAYYSYYFDYVLSLPFKGSRRICSSFYVSYKSVELEHAFYYVPHSLIYWAPQNDATSPEWCNFLNYIYNTYSCKWYKNIYIHTLFKPMGKQS